MNCEGITKKRTKCKNKKLQGENFCRKHLSKKVYNSFYKSFIDYESELNCSPDRESIKDFRGDVLKYSKKYCDILPLNKIKYILGPVSYSEYKTPHSNISIFGELHNIVECDSVNCIDNKSTILFSGFLKELINKNPDKLYDFYLETQYINKKISNIFVYDDSNLNIKLLQHDFQECLSLIKNCPYKNIRTHYADPRFFITKILREKEREKERENKSIFDIFKKKKIEDSFIEFYRNLRNTPDFKITDKVKINSFVNFFYNILVSNDLLFKETKKSYYGKEIRNFVISQFLDYVKAVINLFKTDGYVHSIRLLTFDMFVMDMYMLSRMFRKFDGEYTKNIIVYTGNAHSRTYRLFIERVLMIKPSIDIEEDYSNQCLDMRRLRNSVLLE